MRRAVFALMLIVALVGGCAQQRRGEAGLGEVTLYQQLTAASVTVLVDGRLAGSGWFVEDEQPGLVVTAAHVVWPRQSCEIVTAEGQRLTATAVAWDRAHDVALLQVDGVEPQQRLTLGERMPPPPTRVFLLGTPQFRHDVMITGHVARQQPTFEYYGDSKTYLRCYHISAPAPQGASGGCWVDEQGRVVGLQSGLMRSSMGPSGIAFASDVQAVRQLIESRQDGDNPTARMAVEELWEQPVEFIAQHAEHGRGLVAKLVAEDGPAYEAGVRELAVVLAVDGQRLVYRDDFYNGLQRHAPGDSMTLTIVDPDGGEPHDVMLVLESLEAREGQ